MKDSESFQKVVQKGKGSKEGSKQLQLEKKRASQNRFQALEEEDVIMEVEQVKGDSPVEEGNEVNDEKTQNCNKEKGEMMSDTELEMDQEMT